MFSIVVKADELERKFDTLADRAGDLDVPLGRFGAYLKRRSIERYKAQDFPGLAESTLEKRAQKGLRSLERKLHRDVRKALGRARVGEPAGLLSRLLGAKSIDVSAAETRGIKNRLSVLAEFQRRHRPGGELAARADLKPLSMKQLVALGSREDRAVGRAVGGQILGNLPRTVTVEVNRGSVTVASRTYQHFSGVHNEGGTAGHGAKILKRETLPEPSEADLNVLESILVEHHLLPAFGEK